MNTSTTFPSAARRAAASAPGAAWTRWLIRLGQRLERWSRASDRTLRDLDELDALARSCERHSPNLANELRWFATRHADGADATRTRAPHR